MAKPLKGLVSNVCITMKVTMKFGGLEEYGISVESHEELFEYLSQDGFVSFGDVIINVNNINVVVINDEDE